MRPPALALVAALAGFALPALAQDTYQRPPDPIPQILDADQTPLARPSPDHRLLLLLERPGLPPIAEVAAPELRLAGRRIDPRTNGPSRQSFGKGLRLVPVAGGPERRIETPKDARLGNVAWSADSAAVAFTVTGADGIALWVAEAASGKARALTPPRLNAALGPPCAWISPTAGLVCRMVPEGRGPAPRAPETPGGPVIQESAGRSAGAPTFQDLLQSPADEATFEHFGTSVIATVGRDGAIRPIGAPGLHLSAEPAPDGRFLLVQTAHRPFSYMVPLERFPTRTEVWDLAGQVVRTVADTPLQEEVPIANDAAPAGLRDPGWRQDAAATVAWVEALDGGDPAREAGKRDRVLTLAAPFTGEPRPLLDVGFRVTGVTWSSERLALVEEGWWKTRRARTWLVAPDGSHPPQLVFDRSSEDRYADPGQFATRLTPQGTRVLLTTADGRAAFLVGDGASPEGDRPFLDRIDLATRKVARRWRSAAPFYEEPLDLLDPEGRRLLTRRESVRDVPNYFVRDLKTGTLTRLTDLPDPAPQFAGLAPELIHYKRADGVELSGELYLPPGYDRSKGPLPFLLWAYPAEFKSASAASQVSGSPYRFTRPSGISHLFVLLSGYGVLDDPSMPIVGEGEKEPNDTYVDQLVASAQAAVDALAARGVGDPKRMAVGGHSYGAFMTANLLAHSRLFRAGIARSGAYNRSLTPFGFQSEERTFWQARDTYVAMSPFTWADRIKDPLLLIHGMADNNQGTYPLQSERLYAALRGNGGTARLVLLPAEAHGYRARESAGHTLWEMLRWLDEWVKPVN